MKSNFFNRVVNLIAISKQKLNFIHENTGFDKEVIEKVLDAETRFLIKSGIATELKE